LAVLDGQRNDLQKLARDKGLSTVFLGCYAYKLYLVSHQFSLSSSEQHVKYSYKKCFLLPLSIRMFEEGQCGVALPVKIFLLRFK